MKRLVRHLLLILCTCCILCACSGAQNNRELFWQSKEELFSNGNFDYQIRKSVDGKYGWLVKITNKKPGENKCLSIPERIHDVEVIKVGSVTDGEERAVYNIFGQAVGESHIINKNSRETRNIEELRLPDSIQSIGEYSFSGMSGIKTIKFPKELKEIGDYSFLECSRLENMEFSEQIHEISPKAFAKCPWIKSVKISPENSVLRAQDSMIVEKHENKLIWVLPSCVKAEIPEGVEVLGDDCFYESQVESISLPASLEKIEPHSLEAPALTDISIAEENEDFSVDHQCLYNKKDGALIVGIAKGKKLIISSKVREINGASMVAGIENKSEAEEEMSIVEIPASVKTIRGEWGDFCHDTKAIKFKGSVPPQIIEVSENTSSLIEGITYHVPGDALKVYKKWMEKNGLKNYSIKGSVDFPPNIRPYTIKVDRWDKDCANFFIRLLKYGKPGSDICERGLYEPLIAYEETLDKICKKNPSYFVKKGTYRDSDGERYQAAFFFKDNNAYVLHKTSWEGENHNRMRLANRMLVDKMDYWDEDSSMLEIKLPFPSYVEFSDYDLEESWNHNKRWEETSLFSLCTFQEAREFYGMFSKGTATTDEKNKRIRVCGTAVPTEGKQMDVVAILDFKNKTYTVEKKNGTFLHSCQSFYDSIASRYKCIGRQKETEMLCDNQGQLFVVEKGKRKMLVSCEQMSEQLEKLGYPWNCVGESMKLKLTKIQNHKYYFDVILTFNEEGRWTEKTHFVIDENGKFLDE